MGSLYRRSGRLWIRYQDPSTGKWRGASTGLLVGQEKEARRVLDRAEAKGHQSPVCVSRYAEKWLSVRRSRGLRSAVDDELRLRLHALPRLGHQRLAAVRPRHIRDLLRELDGTLAPGSVRNVYGTLRAMFAEAVVDEHIDTNPCALPRHDLPKNKGDAAWRAAALFTPTEMLTLLQDPGIPLARRTLYRWLYFTGLRIGEALALRWEDIDPNDPLPRICVRRSYSSRLKVFHPTKSGNERFVPMLAGLGNKPAGLEGLVFGDDCGRPQHAGKLLRQLHRDLVRHGLRRRRMHDFRRTCVTEARQAGARKDVLQVVTHGKGPHQTVMDVYTTFSWAMICQEFGKLRLLGDALAK